MDSPPRAQFCSLLATWFAGPLQVVAGQSLFVGEHPAKVEQCVIFRSSGGTGRLFICGLRWTHVQMMARSKDYVWASNRAWAVHEAMDLLQQQVPLVLGTPPATVKILASSPFSEPVYLGKDESDAHLFVVNLRFQLGVTARE